MIFDKNPKTMSEKKTILSTNGAEKKEYPQVKE